MDIDLPKSAGIRFAGTQLKEHEAFLLLIRTASSFQRNSFIFNLFSSRCRQLKYKNLQEVYKYLKEKGFIVSGLDYLDNYYYENIGGVLKGICNLDGSFNSFNLCKHPTYKEVRNELTIIAREFPALEITATIYDSCISDDNKKPAFSFLIKDGLLCSTENHLSSLPYEFREYENLNYNHLNMFAKLLSKDIFGTETELLDWCIKRKYFETLIL
jgi:hypothetical protein